MSKKKKKQQVPPARQIQTLLNKATALHNNGDLPRATELYQSILSKDPHHPDALNLSGLIAFHDQNFDRAKKLITAAIKSCPTMPSFHTNLSLVFLALAEYDQAEDCIHTAIKIDPKNAESWLQLGNLQRTRQQTQEAIKSYRKSDKINHNQPTLLNNLGNALRDTGLYDEALTCYNRAITLDPTMPEIHNNLGNAYMNYGRPEEAFTAFENAIKYRKDFADPYNNIGYLSYRQGRLHQALQYLNKAHTLSPHESAVLHNLGNVYKDMGQFDQAIATYRKALQLKPDFTEVHTNILFAMNYAPQPNPKLMITEARKWNSQQAAGLENNFDFTDRMARGDTVRIGYISPDFCIHSVSFFCLPLFKMHNRDNFEIFCYGDVANPDSMTTQLQKHTDHWQNILGWSDDAVAERIHTDKIDILVDLAGHTANNRLLVFARKPAPIQVSWLGYPNTTGLNTIDYRISDHLADPEGTTDQFYTETIIRLPHSFLCYTPPATTPDVAPPPVIKNGYITFGSFNNITKVTKEVIAAWCTILSRVDQSKILLKGLIFTEKESQEKFFSLFAEHNILPDRIILKPRTASLAEHLETYHDIDIALDPFPYNGTTTTCEALWMGVPVITCRGVVHCARVSSSILRNCGLTELIADNTDQYISKAISLANNLDHLSKLRTNIRRQLTTSHLCNSQQFSKEMEEAFLKMRETWRNQQTQSTSEPPMISPNDIAETTPTLLNNEGEAFFNDGNLGEAEKYFTEAIRLDPRFSRSHNNLGVLSFHLEDYDKAMTCFKQALAINPEDTDALENLSAVLENLNSKNSQLEQEAATTKCDTREELVAQINTFPFWYHKIQLPFDITTPGYAPINLDSYKIPTDLTGKRVLDVGAWDGHWTFEALRRGAKEVIAIDDFSDYLGSLEESDRKAWTTFDFCKKQLGYTDEQCKRVDMSVYDLSINTFGSFDVVFFFGTLYHLRHPLLALDNLAAVCTEEIYVESAILDDFSPYRGGLRKGYTNNDMVMEFYPTSEYGDNDSNWFCPTLKCLVHLVAAAGFENCEGWKLTDQPQELSHCRGFTKGKKINT